MVGKSAVEMQEGSIDTAAVWEVVHCVAAILGVVGKLSADVVEEDSTVDLAVAIHPLVVVGMQTVVDNDSTVDEEGVDYLVDDHLVAEEDDSNVHWLEERTPVVGGVSEIG